MTFLGLTSLQLFVVVVFVVIVILLIRRMRSKGNSIESFLIPNAPKGTILLHQYGQKALTVPSISPYVMKLETYLRVAKIPYENQYSRKPGPRGKLPWIQYNDQIISDSQICVRFLNALLKVDLNKRLKPDQMAVGHLIRRTVEESLYWTLLMWRLVFEKTGMIYQKLGLPYPIIWYMRRSAKPRLWSQGIGRLTQEEVTRVMEDDLSAISQILGDRKFLFGDSIADVTEFDCALFGQLCHIVWQMPGSPVEGIVAEKYPNLVRYCERMKAAFWPDWNDRVMYPNGIDIDNDADEVTRKQVGKISSIPRQSGAVGTSMEHSEPKTFGVISPGGHEQLVTSVNGKATSVTSSVTMRLHKENQVVTSRTTSKVSASSILQDKSSILPAP